MDKLKELNKNDMIQRIIIWFMLYSIAGWIYETILEVFVYRTGFSNRGFLYGPYLPIYGFGALIFVFALQGIKKRKVKIGKIDITILVIFLGVMLISTTIELLGSYIAELFVNKPLWDYEKYIFDFDGRIALDPSIRFGIGGTVFIYLLQPSHEAMCDQMSKKDLTVAAAAILVIFITDFILTLTL